MKILKSYIHTKHSAQVFNSSRKSIEDKRQDLRFAVRHDRLHPDIFLYGSAPSPSNPVHDTYADGDSPFIPGTIFIKPSFIIPTQNKEQKTEQQRYMESIQREMRDANKQSAINKINEASDEQINYWHKEHWHENL